MVFNLFVDTVFKRKYHLSVSEYKRHITWKFLKEKRFSRRFTEAKKLNESLTFHLRTCWFTQDEHFGSVISTTIFTVDES